MVDNAITSKIFKKRADAVPTLSRKRKLSTRMWEARYMYLFLLPALVWHVIFKYVPMYGVLLAFKDFRFDRSILQADWVGLQYFEMLFARPDIGRIISNSLRISVLKTVTGFPMPIILALLLNEVRNRRFKKAVQTVSYLPHFVSWVVVYALFMKVFSPNDGILNELRQTYFGLEPIYYLGKPEYFDFFIIFSAIWKEVGWSSIIYIAAIAALDVEMYEAARIDGASRLKSIFHITLPCLMPTIGILMLLNIGSLVSAGFDQIYLFQNPAVLKVAEVLETYVVKIGLQGGDYSYATALGLIQSLVVLFLIVVSNTAAKKMSGISLW